MELPRPVPEPLPRVIAERFRVLGDLMRICAPMHLAGCGSKLAWSADRDLPVAVICGSGQRAATATSLVVRHGGRDVAHVVDGGVPEWGRPGHELRTTDPTT